MLAMRPDWTPTGIIGAMNSVMEPLVRIHCEVSGEVARMLGLGGETEMTLRHIFETFDGRGMPDRMAGERVPVSVFIVSLAGDLEILSRVYGLERALAVIASKAATHYPERLLRSVTVQAGQWLRTLERREPDSLEGALLTEPMGKMTSPELIADVIDLKLPWMTGYSRGVAEAAGACCAALGLDAPAQNLVYRAGLIHGIGRAAIPNTVWCGQIRSLHQPGRRSGWLHIGHRASASRSAHWDEKPRLDHSPLRDLTDPAIFAGFRATRSRSRGESSQRLSLG
jgi:response regulator RpfG family c-di-GMP phosphodiesterase